MKNVFFIWYATKVVAFAVSLLIVWGGLFYIVVAPLTDSIPFMIFLSVILLISAPIMAEDFAKFWTSQEAEYEFCK